jgi:hypothetical protein
MKITIVYRKGKLPMIKVQNSGTKNTIKVTPSNIGNRLNNIRPNPSPQKGTQNPPHYHIKNPIKPA